MTADRLRLGVVLAVALAVFFANLGAAGLFDEDEPKNAACGAEMFARGDWIVPSFNHELRTDKPILLYWLMLSAYHLCGVSEFSARLASASLAVGTVGLVYALGRRLFHARAGFWAALVLSTSLMFDVVGRAATPDATLVFCTTLSLYVFVAGSRWATDRGPVATPDDRATETWRPWLPRTAWFAAALYGAMALAVLAKGPVGVVLPTLALVVFLLAEWPLAGDAAAPATGRLARAWLALRRVVRHAAPGRLLAVGWALRPEMALAMLAVVALPWYAAVTWQTDGQWLAGFLGKHNVSRFVSPMEGHRGPIFYHLMSIGMGFFPWSVLLPVSLPFWLDQLRGNHRQSASARLLAAWTLTYVVFFSLARTKLPNYVLPAYPALALATGAALAAFWHSPRLLPVRVLRFSLGLLAAVGAGLAVGLPIAAHWVLPGDQLLGLCGLVPLVGGLLAWRWAPQRPVWSLSAVAVTAVAFSLSLFSLAAVRVSRHQTSPQVVQLARRHAAGEPRLATYEFFEPSLVFYAGSRVERPGDPAAIAAFFREQPLGFLVTRADRLEALAGSLPADVSVLYQHQRFLRTHDLVLLGRAAAVSGRPVAAERR